MAVREYEFLFSTRDKTKAGLDSVNRNLKETSGIAGKLQTAMAGISFALAVRALGQLADAWTRTTNRIKIAVTDQQRAALVQEEIYQIAQRSRGALEDSATLYSRLSIASRELGASQSDMLGIIETVNKSIVVGGGDIETARGALLQLSQAFSSPIVRAEEFNSVLEGLPRVARAIAQNVPEAAGSVSRLRAMLLAGELTNVVVFEALKKAGPQIAAEFSRATPTIAQAFQTMHNAAIRAVGHFDQATGASKALSNAIIAMAVNFDTTAKAAIALGAAMLIAFGPQILAAINSVKVALVGLLLAMEAHPLVLLATVVAGLGTGLVLFKDQITPVSGSFATLGDYATVAFSHIGDGMKENETGWAKMGNAFKTYFWEPFKIGAEDIADKFVRLGESAMAWVDVFINTTRMIAVAASGGARALYNSYEAAFVALKGLGADFGEGLKESLFGDFSFSAFTAKIKASSAEFERVRQEEGEKIAKELSEIHFLDKITAQAKAGAQAYGITWREEAEKIALQNLGFYQDFASSTLPLMLQARGPLVTSPAAEEILPPLGGSTDPAKADAAAKKAAAAKAKKDAADKKVYDLELERIKVIEDMRRAATEAAGAISLMGAPDVMKAKVAAAKEFGEAIAKINDDTVKGVLASQNNASREVEVRENANALILVSKQKLAAALAQIDKDAAKDQKALMDDMTVAIIQNDDDRKRAAEMLAAQRDFETRNKALAGNPEGLAQSQSVYDFDVKKINDANSALGKFKQSFTDLGTKAVQDFASATSKAFIGFIKGAEDAGQSFKDFAASMLENIADLIIQSLILYAVQAALKALFSGATAAPDVSGIIASTAGDYARAASGGIVTKPTWLLAGEGGQPEMILPLSKAQEQGFGGGAINVTTIVNVSQNGSVNSQTSQDGANVSASALASSLRAGVLDIIRNEQRTGGSLASTRRA